MSDHRFVICILNDGYPVSLELHKVYEVIPDPDAERMRHRRVIDESGEDYLFPEELFRPVDLPEDAQAGFGRIS